MGFERLEDVHKVQRVLAKWFARYKLKINTEKNGWCASGGHRGWGMGHRHLPMKEQQRKLNEKLRGHDGYYGVTGNIRMLSRLRYEVAMWWRRWL